MTYEPIDTYLPSARGGAQVPQLAGQRVEAARSYAASAGWTVHERPVRGPKGTPAGFVVRQAPAAGSIAPIGAVLLIDVAGRSGNGGEHSRAALGGIATAAAVVAGVFASLWLSERADHDATRGELAEVRVQLDDLTPTPDWTGASAATVDADADAHGWTVVRQSAAAADVEPGTAPGTVVRQLPAPGTALPAGATVVVVLAEP